MDSSDIVLVIVVLTALAFDFTNGFHDPANAMATSIATRALPPRTAVALAAILNFVGAFISLKVAATIAEDIVDPKAITPAIILAGLLGGIFWNLLTWRLGIPSSSSHALIGGVVGAVIVAAGFDAVAADGLIGEVIVPSVLAPILAIAVAGFATFLIYRRIQRRDPEQNKRSFRFPLSTTHVTSGGVMGAGAGKKAASVQWGMAGRMATAWLLTLPMALLAGAFYFATEEIGTEIAGPVVVSVVAAIAAAVLFFEAQRDAVGAKDV